MNVVSDAQEADTASFVDDYLLYMMAQASHTASSAFHRQIEAMGTSVTTWRIMACLYPDRQMNVGELAAKCLTKQPTLTRRLDRLCAEGVTERVHADRDRRGVLVSLTPEGRETAGQFITMARAHEAEILDAFSDGEIAAFKRVLSALSAP